MHDITPPVTYPADHPAASDSYSVVIQSIGRASSPQRQPLLKV